MLRVDPDQLEACFRVLLARVKAAEPLESGLEPGHPDWQTRRQNHDAATGLVLRAVVHFLSGGQPCLLEHLSTDARTFVQAARLELSTAVRWRTDPGGPNLSDLLGRLYSRGLEHDPVGSNRKRNGVFYTPNALIEPLVRRTLEPLCYLEGRVRTPSAILGLRVCDPAMGVGAFLLGAQRFLTNCLKESLEVHGPDTWPGDELAGPPRANLEAAVATSCLFGVDLDPLAVELAGWALWLESGAPGAALLDRIRQRLRCGDSLVGGWLDHAAYYPDRALKPPPGASRQTSMRPPSVGPTEAGSPPHPASTGSTEGTSPQPPPPTGEMDLRHARQTLDAWCALWFWPADQLELAPRPITLENGTTARFPAIVEALPALARDLVEQLAARHRFFHWELEMPAIFRVSAGFDAILGNPPWEIRKPSSMEFFAAFDPAYRGYTKQQALARQRELFRDPAVERAWLEVCATHEAFARWCRHVARSAAPPGRPDDRRPFRHQGRGDLNLYKLFLEQSIALLRPGGRIGFLVPAGLYSDQGCTGLRALLLNETRWEWLRGMENRANVFPIHRSFKFAAIVAEKGSKPGTVETAFHANGVDPRGSHAPTLDYPRDRIERFSPKTHALLELSHPRDVEVLEILYRNGVLLGDDGVRIDRSRKGADDRRRGADSSARAAAWQLDCVRELDMTLDSRRFVTRPALESRGFVSDEHGRWLEGPWHAWTGPASILSRPPGLILSADGDRAIDASSVRHVALPLIEGRMIGQLDFSQKGWVRGTGRTAAWRSIPWDAKRIEPQFLLPAEDYLEAAGPSGRVSRGLKPVFMAVGSPTNTRSMVAALVSDRPCGNAVPVLRSRLGLETHLALVGILNSFAYDFALRARLVGSNLNYFVLEETPLPGHRTASDRRFQALAGVVASLALAHPLFATSWRALAPDPDRGAWYRRWALTPHERLRLRCIADALVADVYGLDEADLRWILRDCHHAAGEGAATRAGVRRRFDPKSFGRVDKGLDPRLRHTVLALAAFRDLKRDGLEVFLDQHDGEGWQVPDRLRLADLELEGPDAREESPVAARLGPRFLPWQLEVEPEASWEACRRHAALEAALLPV